MLFKRFLVILILLLFIVSCSKNEEEQPVSNSPMETENVEEKVKDTQEIVSAINIFPGLSYYDKIDGKHSGVLMAGEIVSYTGQKGENSKGHNFYEIITNENERVWTWASYIFEKSRPGVVKPGMEAFVFSKSNENAVTSEKLKPMTIVAVDSEHKNDTFLKVAWLTEDKGIRHNLYVVSNSVSYNSADIKVARILNKYKEVESKELKEELLSNARNITGVSSDFASYIDFIEQDDFEVSIPDLTIVKEKYKDKITIVGNEEEMVEESIESVNLEVTDLKYNLLDYVMIEGNFANSNNVNYITLYLYNTSTYNLETLPAEISINIDDQEYYLGVIGSILIESKDSHKIQFGFEGVVTDVNKEYLLTFNYINGTKLQKQLAVDPFQLGGEE